MTKVLRRSRWMVLLVSALVSVGLLAATPGTADAKCKIGCLKRKINALSAQVSALSTQLKKDETTLNSTTTSFNSFNSCLRRRAVTQYGDPAETFGYVYDPDGGGVDPTIFTSALDFTLAGDVVDVYLLRYTCTSVPTG